MITVRVIIDKDADFAERARSVELEQTYSDTVPADQILELVEAALAVVRRR